MKEPKTGIEELRIAVRLFNNCRESFNERYTLEQLLLLYRAYARSDWDITPDEWTDDELAAALAGRGNGADHDKRGHDQCTECGHMFDATEEDETPVCPTCKGK